VIPLANNGVILIAGATGGIGSAAVKKLAELGYTVLAGVRSMEQGKRLKKEISSSIIPIEMDITIPSSVQAASVEAGKILGNNGIDGLINTGCIIQGPLELLTLDEIKYQFDVNVFGQIAVTQAFLPFLRKNSGRVINIGAKRRCRLLVHFLLPNTRWRQSRMLCGSN
jgi:NAD(P)-dependent dehydrogenase (short-subunit alcohol dehydrogenase family)